MLNRLRMYFRNYADVVDENESLQLQCDAALANAQQATADVIAIHERVMELHADNIDLRGDIDVRDDEIAKLKAIIARQARELRSIASQETQNANGTVRRMARMARAAA